MKFKFFGTLAVCIFISMAMSAANYKIEKATAVMPSILPSAKLM